MKPQRPPDDAVALLLRQVCDALAAGYSLAEALALIARSSTAAPKCAPLMDGLAAVASGRSSWHEAFAACAATFPREVTDLLAHGEASGQLAGTFELVALEFEQRASMRDSLRGALAWPLAIFGVLLITSFIMLTLVLPAFKDVFTAFGADLPALTLLLIAASDVFVAWWWLILGLAVAAVVAYFRRARWFRPGPAWAYRVLRTPVIGPYLGAAFLLRTSRLLQPVASGRLAAAPVVRYLSASTRLPLFASQARALEEALASGRPLPEAVQAALPWGGNLALALEMDLRSPGQGPSLQHAIEFAQDDYLRKRARLEQVLTGVSYAAVAVLVGSFVIGMYLPIFKLGSVV